MINKLSHIFSIVDAVRYSEGEKNGKETEVKADKHPSLPEKAEKDDTSKTISEKFNEEKKYSPVSVYDEEAFPLHYADKPVKASLLTYIINRNTQPRTKLLPVDQLVFDEAAVCDNVSLARLASSIRNQGVLLPLTVVKCGRKKYKVINGRKRLKAARMLDYSLLCCNILPLTEEVASLLNTEGLPFENAQQLKSCERLKRIVKDPKLLDAAAKLNGCDEERIKELAKIGELKGWEKAVIQETGQEGILRKIAQIEDQRFREYVVDSYKEMFEDFERGVEALIANKDKRYSASDKIILKDIRIVFNSIDKSLVKLTRSGIEVRSKKLENNEEYRFEITVKKP